MSTAAALESSPAEPGSLAHRMGDPPSPWGELARYTLRPMGLLEKLFGITPKKRPLSLNDSNFESEVFTSDLPVLLDVWGPSCGPCKQLEPVIMDLAAHYDGRVKVCELSAQGSPRIAALLNVQATPTVLYFREGKELERIHGFRSSLFHKQTIHEHFGIED